MSSQISQMKKPCFRENEQPAQGPAAGWLAAERWTQVSFLNFLNSFLLQAAFTEDDS